MLNLNELFEVKKVLVKFAKRVISRSRANLTRSKKNVNKSLYNSLDSKIKVSNKGYSLKFLMEDYGQYQDQGVKGKNPSLVKNGKQKGGNSKFSFKNKMPPMQPLADWAKARHIRLRDKKGRFKRGSYKTLGFILQKRIFAQGIKPSLFFTRPFESAFRDLPDDLSNGLIKDFK